jgi:hypothetical protein
MWATSLTHSLRYVWSVEFCLLSQWKKTREKTSFWNNMMSFLVSIVSVSLSLLLMSHRPRIFGFQSLVMKILYLIVLHVYILYDRNDFRPKYPVPFAVEGRKIVWVWNSSVVICNAFEVSLNLRFGVSVSVCLLVTQRHREYGFGFRKCYVLVVVWSESATTKDLLSHLSRWAQNCCASTFTSSIIRHFRLISFSFIHS